MSKYLGNWLVSCEAERERESEREGAAEPETWEKSESEPREEVESGVAESRGGGAKGGEWRRENLSINHFHFTLADNDGENSRKNSDYILGECLTNERRYGQCQ